MIKEYPILFKGPMVLAILAGNKTQTRRTSDIWKKRNPGERLWVRETWWKPTYITEKMKRDGADTWPKCDYDATIDKIDIEQYKEWGWKRKPSIFMPRWASRINLEIVSIREERLQDISEKDAKDEGVTVAQGHLYRPFGSTEPFKKYTHKQAFAALFDSINGTGSWDANPFVYPIEFKVV
jgi:hypothetical protein